METFDCCVEFKNNSVAVWLITFRVFYRLTDVAHIFGHFKTLIHLIDTYFATLCITGGLSPETIQMELLATAGEINQMCIVAVD